MTKIRPIARGFTLIELLVVIAIIALLVTILIPSLQKARELARQTVCLTHLRNMGVGVNYYLQDSADYPIPASWDEDDSRYTGKYWQDFLCQYIDADTWKRNTGRLYGHMGGREAQPSIDALTRNDWDVYSSPRFDCPSRKYAPNSWEYGINAADSAMRTYSGNAYTVTNLWKVNRLAPLSGYAIIMDYPACRFYALIGDTTTMVSTAVHDKSNNALFMDGHAARITNGDVLDWVVRAASLPYNSGGHPFLAQPGN